MNNVKGIEELFISRKNDHKQMRDARIEKANELGLSILNPQQKARIKTELNEEINGNYLGIGKSIISYSHFYRKLPIE